MKLYCHFLILIVLFACSGPPNDQDSSASEVLELEKKRFRAVVEGDIDFLQEVISEDLYYIHSNGSVDTKDSFIGPIATGHRRYTISRSKVPRSGFMAIQPSLMENAPTTANTQMAHPITFGLGTRMSISTWKGVGKW